MKKFVSLMLALVLALSLCSFAAAEDYTDVTIRIYSNSNSTERATWLQQAAKQALKHPFEIRPVKVSAGQVAKSKGNKEQTIIK